MLSVAVLPCGDFFSDLISQDLPNCQYFCLGWYPPHSLASLNNPKLNSAACLKSFFDLSVARQEGASDLLNDVWVRTNAREVSVKMRWPVKRKKQG
jgi:hypothetical protein